jgi:hypothetical protein
MANIVQADEPIVHEEWKDTIDALTGEHTGAASIPRGRSQKPPESSWDPTAARPAQPGPSMVPLRFPASARQTWVRGLKVAAPRLATRTLLTVGAFQAVLVVTGHLPLHRPHGPVLLPRAQPRGQQPLDRPGPELPGRQDHGSEPLRPDSGPACTLPPQHPPAGRVRPIRYGDSEFSTDDAASARRLYTQSSSASRRCKCPHQQPVISQSRQ